MDHARLLADFDDEVPLEEAIETDADRSAGGPRPAKIHRASKGTVPIHPSVVSCHCSCHCMAR